MLVVRIELWPWGLEHRKREIGLAHIINDGTGDVRSGNYEVILFKSAEYSAHNAGKVYRKGYVKGFPRRLGPWPLLKQAIANALAPAPRG